ncbi:uncharacterized protein TNCV_4349061 [Trichonephila clavipes]|nr:uncharacterized protein TNCV_4349061 [Trichonephila clavipes]
MVSRVGIVFLVLAGVFLQGVMNSDTWEDKYRLFGCLGAYDKYKMAHVERICDECYEIYKEQNIHIDCRRNCFGGATFFKCMETVALDEIRKQNVLIYWDDLTEKEIQLMFPDPIFLCRHERICNKTGQLMEWSLLSMDIENMYLNKFAAKQQNKIYILLRI